MSDIKLNIETRRYKLRGLTPILGGQPADPAVRTQYISSRAPSPALGAEEDELLGSIEERASPCSCATRTTACCSWTT